MALAITHAGQPASPGVAFADFVIDVGGTGIDIAAISNGAVVYRHPTIKVSGDSDRGIAGDFGIDIGNIVGAIQEGQRYTGLRIRAIAAAIAGSFDEDKTMLIGAGNLTWWKEKPLRASLEMAFPEAIVVLGHDGAAGALAEAYFNPAFKGVRFGFVVWGTGIGFGFIEWSAEGKPKVTVGEGGHMPINHGNGRVCKCGQLDCWELYCGGAGMCSTYEVMSSKLLDDTQWDEVISRMAAAVRAIQCVLKLQSYVFGGSVAVKEQAHRKVLDVIFDRLRQEMKIVPPPHSFALSRFGEKAGIWGAYALLFDAGLTDVLPVLET